MANTLDLIINLIVKNQDAVKKIADELRGLNAIKMPELSILEEFKSLDRKIEATITITERLVRALGPRLEDAISKSIDAVEELEESIESIETPRIPNLQPERQSLPTPRADRQTSTQSVDPSSIIALSKALGVAYEKAEKLKTSLNLPDDSIAKSVSALRQFAAINVPVFEQFAILNKELGITKSQFNQLSSFVLPQLPEIKVGSFKTSVEDSIRLAQSLGLSVFEAEKLQKSLRLPADSIDSVLSRLRQFESVKLPVGDQFKILNREIGLTQEQFDKIKDLKIKPQGIEETRSGLSKAFGSASQLAFGFNNIVQSVHSMVAAARPAYEYLIGANEKLNQQLLKSAASITATSAVSGADGKTLSNIDSIRALQPKLKETIREVEIATQSLVGVTSQQTSEVFNVILTNTGKLNGQLKSAATGAEKFKDPLDAAAKLAPGLVATLGTMGLPISQAADEVGNLLKGEIDQSAQVAKSLGITREMIESWKAQGVLVDKLTQKFDPFLKANAEAAKSVGGITSNIQDLFEIMGREAGKPLTEGFVSALQSVYDVLQKIMPSVQKVFTEVLAQAVLVAKGVSDSIAPAFQGIGVAISAIAPSIGPVIQSVVQNFGKLVNILRPIAEFAGTAIASIGVALGAILPVALELTNTLAGAFQGVGGVVLGVLSPALVAVGEILKIVAGALSAISSDPIGKIALQAAALAIVLGPVAIAAIELGGAILALGGMTGGVATLGTVVAGLAPGLASAITAVIGFGSSAVAAFGAIQLSAAPIISAFTVGGLSAGISAVGTAVMGLVPAFATASAAAAPFLLAMAPLIAIGGAIAVTLAIKGAKDLENVQQELDDLRQTTNDITDSARRNAERLKALAEAAASGGLSEKQKQDQKDLIFGSKQQLKLIEEQIAAIKKQKQEAQGQGASQEQLNQFDIQQQQLENTQKTLSKYADAVKIASQELTILGTTNEQIAQKLKAAQGILDAGVGDPQKYKESAKLQIELIQKQVEIGTLAADEGAKILAKSRDNTKLDYEAQLAAKKAIVDLYKSRFEKIEELQSTGQLSNSAAEKELESVRTNTDLEIKIRIEAAKKLNAIRKETADAELAEVGAKTAEIAAKKAAGNIGEAEAARQTTLTKIEESKIRIRQQQEELANELNPEARRRLEAEVRKSQAEITKIEAEERDRRNAERLKDFDEQAKILQAGLDKGRITEDKFNAEMRSNADKRSQEELKQLTEKLGKLASTDKEGREAIQAQIAEAESKQEANKKAANERELATLQQSLEKTADLVRDAETNKKLEVEKAIADGVKTRAEGEAEIAKVAIEGAEKTIEAERSKLEKLKSFPPFLNPKENEALQNQIRDQENKTNELQLSLIKKRMDAERSALEERKRMIDEEYNRKNQAAKNQDLDQQIELERAVLSGAITRAEADNKIAKSAQNRIDSELQAERRKYEELKNLKPLSNPEEERRRQDSLRAEEEKLKNAELNSIKKAQEVKRSNEEVEKNIARDRKEAAEKDQKAAEETAKNTLDEIVAANRAADDEIRRSRSTRLEESKKLELAALKKTGFDAEKISIETAKRELRIEQETIEESYRLKIAQAEQLKELLASRSISGEAAIEAERKIQQEISDLNLKRIDLEKKALEQLRAEKVRQIELEANAGIKPLQKRVDLLTQQKTLLEQQNALISAQDRLESASFNLAKQRSSFAIEEAKARGDEAGAKQLEVSAARDQLEFTKLQNKSKIESITLGLEQKAIDMAMAKLQAEIARIQSEANLEKAIAEGKSKEVIDALRREVSLRTVQESLTRKAADNQKIIGGKELAAAQLEGQTAIERDQRAIDKAAGVKGGGFGGGYNPGAVQAQTPIFEPKITVQLPPDQPRKPAPKAEPEKQEDPETRKAVSYVGGGNGDTIKKIIRFINQAGETVNTKVIDTGKTSLNFDRQGRNLEGFDEDGVVGKPKKPATPAKKDESPTAKAGKELEKPIADVGSSSERLGKSIESASTAIDQFTGKLKTVTAIPSRFTGGPVGAGEDFFGAEKGPELARHTDGSYQILMSPGIYNLAKSAQIIPANETQQILQQSASILGGGTGVVQSINPIMIADNSAVIDELRALRSIVSTRRPQMNIPVTFSAPADNGADQKMAEFARMLVRSGI